MAGDYETELDRMIAHNGEMVAPELFGQLFGGVKAMFIATIFIEQVHVGSDAWFPLSNSYWNQHLGLSAYQVKVFCEDFASCGLETKMASANPSPTRHFHLDIDYFKARTSELYQAMINAPPPYVKANIPEPLRRAVFARDGYICLICGTASNLTIDHVYPEIRGGTLTLENLQTLCKSCNSRKRDRLPDQA
jgi:hypothetical protein